MDLQSYGQIAEIITAISIFLTLVFLVIELRKNMAQTKSVNISNRDILKCDFFRFWADEKNAQLVVKGRDHFESLNSVELFQFESFIEQRVEIFAFGSTTVSGENKAIFNYKIREFFQYPGALECYQKLVSNKLIPPVWRNVIDPALAQKATKEDSNSGV